MESVLWPLQRLSWSLACPSADCTYCGRSSCCAKRHVSQKAWAYSRSCSIAIWVPLVSYSQRVEGRWACRAWVLCLQQVHSNDAEQSERSWSARPSQDTCRTYFARQLAPSYSYGWLEWSTGWLDAHLKIFSQTLSLWRECHLSPELESYKLSRADAFAIIEAR